MKKTIFDHAKNYIIILNFIIIKPVYIYKLRWNRWIAGYANKVKQKELKKKFCMHKNVSNENYIIFYLILIKLCIYFFFYIIKKKTDFL